MNHRNALPGTFIAWTLHCAVVCAQSVGRESEEIFLSEEDSTLIPARVLVSFSRSSSGLNAPT